MTSLNESAGCKSTTSSGKEGLAIGAMSMSLNAGNAVKGGDDIVE